MYSSGVREGRRPTVRPRRLTGGGGPPIVKNMLKHDEPLDLVFQALANPTRRGIVERLTRGPASVTELARPLEMTLPGVMQHLAVLEASGIVRSRKVGRVRTCTVEPAVLRGAERWIADRRLWWERRLDRLGEVLAEDTTPRQDAADAADASDAKGKAT